MTTTPGVSRAVAGIPAWLTVREVAMPQTVATVDEHSPLSDINEAISHCLATAQRTSVYDSLSRPNPTHEALHRWLDHLLDLRAAAL